MGDRDAELERALAMIAAATRLDWTQPRGRPGAPGAIDPDVVVRAAPREAAVAALSALSHDAGPAGRVWATQLLVELAPGEGQARLAALVTDPSPVEVNTCLVGYRTVGAWARDTLARVQPAPPPRRRRWWWPW